METLIEQFRSVTGAPVREAKQYLQRYKRVDIAVDAYYNEPAASIARSSGPSTTKLNQLFDTYKDPNGEDITIDGTLKLCEDLGVDPEDVVLLSIAYELKSPGMGQWTKEGWTSGWRSLGVDTLPAMKTKLVELRNRLAVDPEYFQSVYNYTFEFSRPAGQRSLALDMAQGFWALLIPHGLHGGALSHVSSEDDDDEDEDMDRDEGWKDEYTGGGGKGVSKDVWQMFREFVRTIDSKFETYDIEAAWPSTIDEFVDYAKARLAGSSH
ncbi:Defective in cullin neddylation protein 1 [Grifola frondosa]|uniref:Defective in cullin neddylation protein n=1 Tax=Grifola frondosa TaxID=5627 RepID=A0A1C7MD20_GRIFR|nr:Defective in cullin neddylation protein 1 [Grifola frondosa]